MIRRLMLAALVMGAVALLAHWTDLLHLLAGALGALALGLLALVAALIQKKRTPEGLDEYDEPASGEEGGPSLLREGLGALALGGLGLALGALIYSYALPPFYPWLVGDCPQLLPKLAIYEETQAWRQAVALIDQRLARPIDRNCRAQLAERKCRYLIEWSKGLPRAEAEAKLAEAQRWADANGLPQYHTIAALMAEQLQPTPGPTLVTPTPPPSPTPRPLPAGATAQLTGLDLAYYPPTAFAYLRVADAAGQPVGDLAASDMRASVDGKPVEELRVAQFSQAPAPIYAAVVIDCSGSMAGAPLAAARAGAQAFLGLMGPRDQVELIGFNDKAQVLQTWTADRQAAGAALDLLEAKDWTALWDALYLAGSDLAGCSGRKVAVVLSDGADNRSQHSRDEVIAQARRAGLSIFAIGLRSAEYDGAALQSLVQAVGGRYAEATDPGQLEEYYRQMAGAIRNEYRLALTLPALPAGSHRLRLEVGGPQPLVVEQTFEEAKP
jgi:VWFA-related protein